MLIAPTIDCSVLYQQAVSQHARCLLCLPSTVVYCINRQCLNTQDAYCTYHRLQCTVSTGSVSTRKIPIVPTIDCSVMYQQAVSQHTRYLLYLPLTVVYCINMQCLNMQDTYCSYHLL